MLTLFIAIFLLIFYIVLAIILDRGRYISLLADLKFFAGAALTIWCIFWGLIAAISWAFYPSEKIEYSENYNRLKIECEYAQENPDCLQALNALKDIEEWNAEVRNGKFYSKFPITSVIFSHPAAAYNTFDATTFEEVIE